MNKITNAIYLLVALFIFSNFFTYCSTRPDILPINLTHLIFGILSFSVLLVFVYFKENNYFYHKLNIWIIFYLFVYLFWGLFNDFYLDSIEFRRNFLAIISLLTFIVFFSFEEKKMYYTRLGIAIATLISCFNNVYEFFNPETFFPINSEFKTLGRSAGFFINSNIAGTALNLGLILTIGIVQKKYRSIYAFAVFIGILPTFSRSGIAGWFLIMILLNYKNILDVKRIVIFSIVLLGGIYIVLPRLSSFVNENMPEAVNNITNRLLWFSNPELHQDFSQNERQFVAGKAWKHFTEKPYFGSTLR